MTGRQANALLSRPKNLCLWQRAIITAFLDPQDDRFSFETLYQLLSDRGFVIYPGRLTQLSAFRIGNIGRLFPSDLEQLVLAVREA
jgi:2-aminoethylphosphonate-pyruvate transaminase